MGRPRVVVGSTTRAVAAALRPVLVEITFAGGDGVPLDTLDTVWPERSRAAIQTAIWRLRRLLGADAIVTEGGIYRLGADLVVDLDRFEDAVTDGLTAAEDGDHRSAGEHLRRALALWRAAPDPVVSTEAGRTRRERVVELHAAAVEHLARIDIEAGAVDGVTGALRDLLDTDPLRERAWALLIAAHEAGGDSAVAAAVATEAVGVLGEAGVEPSDELARVLVRNRRVLQARGSRDERALPSWLAASRRAREFVGRVDELDLLARGLERAAGGHTVAAVVSGMSGAGKTRLLAEAATLAAARGITVRAGRWDRHVRTPHQGLVEVLRGLVDETPLGVVAASALESFRTGDDGARADGRPFDLSGVMDIVGRVVAEVSSDRPTLLVFDDVQWAHRISLLLLRHLVQADPDVPLAVFVACNTGIGLEPATRPVLDSLVRPDGSRWIELGGLTNLDVASLPAVADAAQSIGADARSLARSIVSSTDGNPLLIDRVLDEPGYLERLHRADPVDPDTASLPTRVAAAAGALLAALDADTRSVLAVAALIGREFDLALLERVVGVSVATALAAGDAARIIEVHGHRGSFVHDLLAEALIDAMDADARRAAHARIAAELAGPDGTGPVGGAFALVHHLNHAGPLVDAGRVADVAVRAASEARTQFAFGIAARCFEVAADHAPVADAVDHLLAAVEMATLEGDVDEAARLLGRAERLARSGAFTVALGKVAVAACELSLRRDDRLSAEASALVREVRSRIDPGVDGDLVAGLAFFDSLGRAAPGSLVDVARAEPDPSRAVAIAEGGLELGPLATRPVLVMHLRRSASDDGKLLGAVWDWVVGVQDGAVALDDPERAAELDDLLTAPGVTPEARWRVASWAATRAIARGDFRLGGELTERAARLSDAASGRQWRMRAVMARWMHHGCLEFLTGVARGRVHGVGRHWGAGTFFSRPWDAHRLAWVGRLDEARALLADAVAQARRRVVPDAASVVRLVLLASAAHSLRDESMARAVRTHLEPHRGRAAVHVDGFIGVVDHSTALLTAAAGDLDAAITGFRSAADQATTRGAHPFAVLSRMQLLVHLQRRGGSDDAAECARLRPSVLADADRLGMPRVRATLTS